MNFMKCENLSCINKESLKSFMTFKTMMTPCLIQILFLIGLIYVVFSAIVNFFHGLYLQGIINLIAGPIILRVGCEVFILFFKMNNTLEESKTMVQHKAQHFPKAGRPRPRHNNNPNQKRPHTHVNPNQNISQNPVESSIERKIDERREAE